MLYIIHKSGKYSFHQVARCKHCLYCYLHSGKFGDYGTYTCSLTRKFISPDFIHCSNFVCNNKFKIYKSSVQLNLFDHE